MFEKFLSIIGCCFRQRPENRSLLCHTAVHSPIKRHVLILYDKPEQCIRIRRIISGADDDGVLREVKLLPKQLPHRLLRLAMGRFDITITAAAAAKRASASRILCDFFMAPSF